MMSRAVQDTEDICYQEDDLCSNPRVENTIGEIISRRDVLKTLVAAGATALLAGPAEAAEKLSSQTVANLPSPSSLTFAEVTHGLSHDVEVAAGYEVEVLLRWGDPILSTAADFDSLRQSSERQLGQFGYNCDFIAFLPLPPQANGLSRGLLCVNHEYTNTNLMLPGITGPESLQQLSQEMVDVELAALGHSVCEIQLESSGWVVRRDSPLNRRISALHTEMTVSGPAAGHPRLQTTADPTGKRVLGTLNNCAGGVTPWGTMLICEENFNAYFSGAADATPEARNHKRYGIDGPSRFSPAWAKHYPRFDVEQEPNEPNRFGWVVEFDPHDPRSIPVKRTALGRVKHEGAGIVVNHDGRVVIYCGDDERFDYVYRFVTARSYDETNPAANRDLLDEGVLSAARFDDDGTVTWLPLIFGQGPLTAEHGFHSQADVLIETRRAADLMGATPMDRPEDIEPSPTNDHVFVILTNNDKRAAGETDKANPRAENQHGHVLEMTPPELPTGVNHAAETFRWEVFLRAGDPLQARDHAKYHPDTSRHGWFSSPDNCTFDAEGRLWLTTDSDQESTGFGDGIYACDTAGSGRALPKLFFRGPRGSEVSGVCISPDCETLFVSVQHPGEERGSDFQSPVTRWPDFSSEMPPRPAVVAIRKRGGGVVGS